jgi:peptide/nickel transport system permease protein
LFSDLFKNRASKVGLALLLAVIAAMVIGILVDPRSPNAIGPLNKPPSLSYPFGTDFRGHDLLSQIAWGSSASLSLSFYSAIGGTLLGFAAGILAGYYGKLEPVIAGGTDVVLCFPHIPLLVLIALIFPANNSIIVLVLILVMWGPVSRAIRAQTLAVRRLSYVDSIKMSGMRDIKIVWKVLSQEVASIGLAWFVINLSIAIVLITSLEFIGVGNPLAVNWGSILYWAQQYAFGYGDWWWVLAPGIIISLVATGFALIGTSFEEMMNPRLRM